MSDNRLWGVNIQGPDDMIAARSYDEAALIANLFNKWWSEHIRKQGGIGRHDPLMWAVPCEWPNPQGHAEDLAHPSRDYDGFISAAREALA